MKSVTELVSDIFLAVLAVIFAVLILGLVIYLFVWLSVKQPCWHLEEIVEDKHKLTSLVNKIIPILQHASISDLRQMADIGHYDYGNKIVWDEWGFSDSSVTLQIKNKEGKFWRYSEEGDAFDANAIKQVIVGDGYRYLLILTLKDGKTLRDLNNQSEVSDNFDYAIQCQK